MAEEKKPEGFRSYRSLFRLKYKIYAIGDKPLPRPIPVDLAIIYLVLLAPSCLIVGPLANMADTSPLLLGMAAAGFFTWLLGRVDPQGEPMPIFIANIIGFIFKYKKNSFNNEQAKIKRKQRLDWECIKIE